MAMGLFSKVVTSKVNDLLKSDEPEKTPPTEKELKEDEEKDCPEGGRGREKKETYQGRISEREGETKHER